MTVNREQFGNFTCFQAGDGKMRTGILCNLSLFHQIGHRRLGRA